MSGERGGDQAEDEMHVARTDHQVGNHGSPVGDEMIASAWKYRTLRGLNGRAEARVAQHRGARVQL